MYVHTNRQILILPLFLFFLAPLSFARIGYKISYRAQGVSSLYVCKFPAQDKSITSEAELAEVIGRLEQPETRMQALSELCRFASSKLYQRGSFIIINADLKIDALQGMAVEAVRKHTNIETVSEALASNDSALQFWGLLNWRTGIYEPHSYEITEWLSLMPLVKKLAVEGDDNIRSWAVKKLMQCPGTKYFLDERTEYETSADVVSELARRGLAKEYDKRLNPLLLRLLFNEDEKIRKKALLFIGSNSQQATGLQSKFDMEIYERTLELTYARSDEERSAATYALVDTRHLEPERSREAFLRLSKDISESVRWRVGFGLAKQFEQEDVKPVITALLSDPSSLVRLMTISAGGPKKFVKELIQLTQDPDPEIAKSAAGFLKRIEQDKNQNKP